MTTREARPEDLPDMARIRVDTWKAAYRGIVPDAYLDSLTYTATGAALPSSPRTRMDRLSE